MQSKEGVIELQKANGRYYFLALKTRRVYQLLKKTFFMKTVFFYKNSGNKIFSLKK